MLDRLLFLTNSVVYVFTFDVRFLDLFRQFVDLGPLNNLDEPDVSLHDDEIGLEEAGGGGRLPGDDLRNLRFKLLPSILEGPWIVRKAVGSKPTLIAQKVSSLFGGGPSFSYKITYIIEIFSSEYKDLNVFGKRANFVVCMVRNVVVCAWS